MMTTTLNKLDGLRPGIAWERLSKKCSYHQILYGQDIPIATILEFIGLEDAIFCLRSVHGHDREIALMAAEFARSVVNLYNFDHPNDLRPSDAINAAVLHANGKITAQELYSKSSAAGEAARQSQFRAFYAAYSAYYASHPNCSFAARHASLFALQAYYGDPMERWTEEQKQKEILLTYAGNDI